MNEQNGGKEAERSRRYREQNREKRAEYDRRWYEQNRERKSEYKQQWWQQNPEKAAQYNSRQRWLKANAGGYFTSEQWLGLCDVYGNRCLCCGESGHGLHADHVVPLSKGGSNDIGNIQPLCGPCNSSKGTKVIDYRGDSPPVRLIAHQDTLFDLDEDGAMC